MVAFWAVYKSILICPTTAFVSTAFVSKPWRPFTTTTKSDSLVRRFSTRPQASSSAAQQQQQQQRLQQQRRQTLLSRRGPYFKLDRMRGTVEFGSTVDLITTLTNEPNAAQISAWLSDERGLALSIWDESLITELKNSVYRLQLMTLQFVTLQLSPTVDVKMWTTNTASTNTNRSSTTSTTVGVPVFQLQSVAFDPRLQILPGIGVNADMLGIDIVGVGEMRPTPNGRGVQGRISFATTGKLPPPLLMLPEGILKGAAQSISDEVAQFDVQSFERGAIQQYRQFCRKQPPPLPSSTPPPK